jgi:alkylation response protein AidB-like acyl-CoA dehydrogenase
MLAPVEFDVSAEDRVFRDAVREFLATHLPEVLREASRATPTVFAEPEISRRWQGILHEQGWLAYNWPDRFGGTGWSPMQRYIFEKECALADAPGLPVLGLKLLAPVLCEYGTAWQQQFYLPKILTLVSGFFGIWRGVGSGEPAHQRDPGWRRVRAEWRQVVDHARTLRRPHFLSGAHRKFGETPTRDQFFSGRHAPTRGAGAADSDSRRRS